MSSFTCQPAALRSASADQLAAAVPAASALLAVAAIAAVLQSA